MKILLPGGAGLVGQNLVVPLQKRGYSNITVIDNHDSNTRILKMLHPDIKVVQADLSVQGEWEKSFQDADVVVMLQAQIGGNVLQSFLDNNVRSTQNILNAIKNNSVPYLVHISSSVVQSMSNDLYTITKKRQETLVNDSSVPSCILRPTLMFGWFDRKHLGWLSRFMNEFPIFPIPGNGEFIRQPLYAGDFCNIIISCIENRITSRIFNISGYETITYIDIIRSLKKATRSKSLIIRIPYWFFFSLLWFWGMFDRNPPFTTQQLTALKASDEFEVIEWPEIFGVSSTPFDEAINLTFNDPQYSKIVLDF